jgi:hypothetical protein
MERGENKLINVSVICLIIERGKKGKLYIFFGEKIDLFLFLFFFFGFLGNGYVI